MKSIDSLRQAFQEQINDSILTTKHVTTKPSHNSEMLETREKIKSNFLKIPNKETDEVALDDDCDNMYVNITSSPRKKPLYSPKKRAPEEEKESLSKMIENGNNLLRSIITTLSSPNTYQMSDWEEEGAMKDEDIDQESDTFDGKKIPSWALVEPLNKSISNQRQSDGDSIFANLPRRCNLEAVFGTKSIPYYMKQKK